MPSLVTRRGCLLGFGNVGRRFRQLVAHTSDELAREHGLRVAFTAVGTGSHGSLPPRDGLSAAEVLAAAGAGSGRRRSGRRQRPAGRGPERRVPRPDAAGR